MQTIYDHVIAINRRINNYILCNSILIALHQNSAKGANTGQVALDGLCVVVFFNAYCVNCAQTSIVGAGLEKGGGAKSVDPLCKTNVGAGRRRVCLFSVGGRSCEEHPSWRYM